MNDEVRVLLISYVMNSRMQATAGLRINALARENFSFLKGR
jgi:hypothetical protein